MERPATVAIVGVGLIGGSIGLALRSAGLTRDVRGVGRDSGRLEAARSLGAIDTAWTDLETGVRGAQVVVVCTPVGRIARDVITSARAAGPDALIMDAGSTKASIVASVERDALARQVFVGAHPIAGSEKSGAAHARADLFQDRTCVLTPTPRTPEVKLAQARAFWEALQARVVVMTPDAHDEALALTSHLPHVLAAALARVVPVAYHHVAAGAYRDTTRVSASDPGLWSEIYQSNQAHLCLGLEALIAELTQFRDTLESGERNALEHYLDVARSNRRQYDAMARPPRADDAAE